MSYVKKSKGVSWGLIRGLSRVVLYNCTLGVYRALKGVLEQIIMVNTVVRRSCMEEQCTRLAMAREVLKTTMIVAAGQHSNFLWLSRALVCVCVCVRASRFATCLRLSQLGRSRREALRRFRWHIVIE